MGRDEGNRGRGTGPIFKPQAHKFLRYCQEPFSFDPYKWIHPQWSRRLVNPYSVSSVQVILMLRERQSAMLYGTILEEMSCNNSFCLSLFLPFPCLFFPPVPFRESHSRERKLMRFGAKWAPEQSYKRMYTLLFWCGYYPYYQTLTFLMFLKHKREVLGGQYANSPANFHLHNHYINYFFILFLAINYLGYFIIVFTQDTPEF